MKHFVNKRDLFEHYPEGMSEIILGAGCFWGVEKKFWDLEGVFLTSVGYSGGNTINPTYEDVCYKNTNHVEVVKITYDPNIISLKDILRIFWECHDPTQGMRQGNDIGTQYRSVIFASNNYDLDIAIQSKEIYQKELEKNIFVKVRSTGSLLEAKIDLKDDNTANVSLIYPEDGISPGQACVFYNKDQFGHKVLGGGWIKD